MRETQLSIPESEGIQLWTLDRSKYMCVCVCVRERERDNVRKNEYRE